MTTLTAARVVTVARSKLGVWFEHPDGSNHVPDVTDVYGVDPGPWCAMGVSRIFALAGDVSLVAFTTSKGFAYCPSGIAGFQRRGQWHRGTNGIRGGDVIFFDWTGDGVSDHVGIVEYVDGAGVHTIECNSDNRCERRLRNANIVGYGRPEYASSAPAPSTTQEDEMTPQDWARIEAKFAEIKGATDAIVIDAKKREEQIVNRLTELKTLIEAKNKQ